VQLRLAIAACLLTGGIGLAAGLLLADAAPAPEPVAAKRAPVPGANRTEVRSKMVADIVDKLVSHDWEAARQEFTHELAKAIPAEKLQMVWGELEVKLGGFKDIGTTKHEVVQGFDVYLVRFNFELDAVDLKIAIGPEGKVIGFFVQPPGQPVLGV
jgi:hypothetical protein